MPITINGTGTITGISAGGYPDATITADDLAATLDLSGKTLTLPSKYQVCTRQSVADQSSATSINFENLPTDTVKIQVNWWEVGGTSYTGSEDNRIIVQLGTTASHTYKTSGYNTSSFNVSTSSASSLGIHSINYEGASFFLWANNEQENAHLEFTKVGGNRWVFAGQSQISNAGGWTTQSTGSFDLGADVTCVRLTTRGGTNTLGNGNSSVMTWSTP